MVEGFWIVQFQGPQGNGGGVAVFVNGKVFGGDSGSHTSARTRATLW